jgi:hypothetical protein
LSVNAWVARFVKRLIEYIKIRRITHSRIARKLEIELYLNSYCPMCILSDIYLWDGVLKWVISRSRPSRSPVGSDVKVLSCLINKWEREWIPSEQKKLSLFHSFYQISNFSLAVPTFTPPPTHPPLSLHLWWVSMTGFIGPALQPKLELRLTQILIWNTFDER